MLPSFAKLTNYVAKLVCTVNCAYCIIPNSKNLTQQVDSGMADSAPTLPCACNSCGLSLIMTSKLLNKSCWHYQAVMSH